MAKYGGDVCYCQDCVNPPSKENKMKGTNKWIKELEVIIKQSNKDKRDK